MCRAAFEEVRGGRWGWGEMSTGRNATNAISRPEDKETLKRRLVQRCVARLTLRGHPIGATGNPHRGRTLREPPAGPSLAIIMTTNRSGCHIHDTPAVSFPFVTIPEKKKKYLKKLQSKEPKQNLFCVFPPAFRTRRTGGRRVSAREARPGQARPGAEKTICRRDEHISCRCSASISICSGILIA